MSSQHPIQQVLQTPSKQSGHKESSDTSLVSQMKDELKVHLTNSISSCYCNGRALYPSLIEQGPAITKYLENSELYDSQHKRWVNIPVHASLERNLYAPFDKIFQEIFDHFDCKSQSRWIVDTHAKQMLHRRPDVVYLDSKGNKLQTKSAPDFCILGAGTYFAGTTTEQPPAGYLNAVSFVEIKTEQTLKADHTMLQAAVYARQCFELQDTRERVVCSIVTEDTARIILYDRSGAVRMAVINIHDEAEDFVRVLLGAASPDPNIAGLDPRITFVGNGKKLLQLSNQRGWNGEQNQAIDYILGEVLFHRMSIVGRGTVCYEAVQNSDASQECLVKISWRQEGRNPEYEIYKDLVGLDGVGQMIAYDEDDSKTTTAGRVAILDDYPGSVLDDMTDEESDSDVESDDDSGGSSERSLRYTPAQDDPERIKSTIILEKYGPILEKFESPLGLLCAFRDAVAGHKNMWIKGILHRDVSAKNILHGVSGATEGNRGKIIDFDMALRINRESNTTKGSRTGTRAYQSVTLLRSRGHPQDHQDDLESFVYVLGSICCRYNGPHKPLEKNISVLLHFEHSDDNIAASIKLSFLHTPSFYFAPFFRTHTIFINLFIQLGKLCRKWIDQKDDLYLKLSNNGIVVNPKAHFDTVTQIHAQDIKTSADDQTTAQDHDGFLAIIDEAIEGLRRIPASGTEVSANPATPEPSGGKRRDRRDSSGAARTTKGSSKRSKHPKASKK